MANLDAAAYTLRFNEISQAVEYANGLNWLAVPIIGSDLSGNTDVTITADADGTPKTWTFDTTGTLDIPGDITNTTTESSGFVVGAEGLGSLALNDIISVYSDPPGGANLVEITGTTTTQRDASDPFEGTLIYNATTHTLNYFDGTDWQEVAIV